LLTATSSERTGAMAGDQLPADARGPARCAPGALGRDQLEQRVRSSASGTVVLGQVGQLLQQQLVLLRPVDGGGSAVGAVAPQIGDAALEHEDELVGGRQQAVAQEAGHLDRARRLLDARADRGRPVAMRRA
jgi:hypothetical protein